MTEMTPIADQPTPAPPPVNDGLLIWTKVPLATPNGTFEVETAIHDTTAFLASYGVTDPSKPPFMVLCRAVRGGGIEGEPHWLNVFTHTEEQARTLMFTPTTWCSKCQALVAMLPVAPALPMVAQAPVIVPAGSQLALEHVQPGNGQQTASVAVMAPVVPAAPAAQVFPVLTEADLANIMQQHFARKQEVARITAELEAAKAHAVEPFKPLLDRGIKKLTYQGVKYSLVQKAGQLPYLRTGEK